MTKIAKFVSIMLTTCTVTLYGLTMARAGVIKEDGAKPLATCKSGATWYSRTGQHGGACSGNGGVAKWLDGTPTKGAAPAPVKKLSIWEERANLDR